MTDSVKKKYSYILASKSPRRRMLLEKLGFDFIIRKSLLEDESYPDALQKEEIAVYLAKQKAVHTQCHKEQEMIIAADTIVWMNDKVLGKPANYAEAHQMLRLLSGGWHSVITGVCLRTQEKSHCFSVETLVLFSELEDEEIRHYIEKYRPYDKTGAYGIQEWIGFIGVSEINGSFFNVVGLPLQKLYSELKLF